MRHYFKALPLIAFMGLMVAAGACGVEASVGVGVDPTPVACWEDGSTCSDDWDCCGYNCNGGVCGAAFVGCAVDNEACHTSADCCSGTCASDGFCGLPSGVTGIVYADPGVECVYDYECLSNACIDNVCGELVNGCFGDGTDCSNDSDCCSEVCDYGICGSGNATCGYDGEACSYDSDCCGNYCADDGMCG